MARAQKRKAGSRNYKTGYSEDGLKSTINAVKTNQIALRKASKAYGILFETLRNKTKGLHTGKVGQPFRLTPECEAQILDAIQCLTVWKVSLIERNISFLVKGYLHACGVVDSGFKNNLPGSDWLDIFVKRNGFTKRLADNVKTNPAEITQNTINRYFDNLQKTIKGIPPENCFNYNETNLTNALGQKK